MKRKIKLFLFLLFVIFFMTSQKKAFAYDFNNPPNRVIIPSLAINLPVSTSRIIFTTWEVSLSGASFGDSTTLPGNIGNTAIFAHARVGLFKDLPKIKIGDVVHVFTSKDWFAYRVNQIKIVNPEDISVLNPSTDFELILYTCIGANYEQRFIAKAELINPIPPETLSNLN